jgi:hypothetical protein
LWLSKGRAQELCQEETDFPKVGEGKINAYMQHQAAKLSKSLDRIDC